MKRVWSLIALGACLAVCGGCGSMGRTGGLFGTGVGDGEVSDLEAAALNIGGEAAGVYGIGTKAQKVRPPSKPDAAEAAAMRFPLLSTTTQYWDSVGTVVKPPIHFRVDPEYGSVTGTYGVAKAPAAPAVDPALVQAVLDALGRPPAHPDTWGASAPVTGNPATPAAGGDAGGPIAQQIRDSLTPE